MVLYNLLFERFKTDFSVFPWKRGATQPPVSEISAHCVVFHQLRLHGCHLPSYMSRKGESAPKRICCINSLNQILMCLICKKHVYIVRANIPHKISSFDKGTILFLSSPKNNESIVSLHILTQIFTVKK